MINHVRLDFGIFKPDGSIQELSGRQPDLFFKVQKFLDRDENINDGKWIYIDLCYSIADKLLQVNGKNVPPDPESWHSSEQVTSIPDMYGSSLVGALICS